MLISTNFDGERFFLSLVPLICEESARNLSRERAQRSLRLAREDAKAARSGDPGKRQMLIARAGSPAQLRNCEKRPGQVGGADVNWSAERNNKNERKEGEKERTGGREREERGKTIISSCYIRNGADDRPVWVTVDYSPRKTNNTAGRYCDRLA